MEYRFQEQMKQEKELLKKTQKEREKRNQGIQELMAKITRSLIGDSAFTKDILAGAIDAEQKAIQNLDIKISEMERKLNNKEEAFSRLDYDYQQFNCRGRQLKYPAHHDFLVHCKQSSRSWHSPDSLIGRFNGID